MFDDVVTRTKESRDGWFSPILVPRATCGSPLAHQVFSACHEVRAAQGSTLTLFRVCNSVVAISFSPSMLIAHLFHYSRLRVPERVGQVTEAVLWWILECPDFDCAESFVTERLRGPVLRDESNHRVMKPSETLVTNTATPSAQHHQFGNSTTRATVLSLAEKALLRRFSTEDSVKKPLQLNGPDGRPPMNETIARMVFFVMDANSLSFVMDTLQECSDLGDERSVHERKTDRNTVSGCSELPQDATAVTQSVACREVTKRVSSSS